MTDLIAKTLAVVVGSVIVVALCAVILLCLAVVIGALTWTAMHMWGALT